MIGVVFSTGMGPGQLEVSPDLNHSVQLHGDVVAMETAQLVLNPYRAFKRSQSAIKGQCILWKNIHSSRFFWNTVYVCMYVCTR